MNRLLILSFFILPSMALGQVAQVAQVAQVGQDRPLPPREAPKRMTLPAGFNATLFAGEPDVVQPIAMTFDDRGRLWVVECLSYPKWTDKPEGSDRVILFEDTDGDGKFDKRQVVFDKGANLSGIELGFGGIWLCSIPNLLFIPCDFNADAPKIGKPEAVLDGWTLKCKHNVFNGLAWGPDGWLYGCNGIIDMSKVGKPGTPDDKRILMNCGVWRYHPTRKVFEPFAHGTTNPFGLDFDENGECFMTNCVIGHLWHVIPGAHFERMYGQDLNPHTYQLMKTCADHIHWGGGSWTSSRGGKGIHSEAGGGHAHVGCMIYLGDNWPDKYRNGAFMLNLHGSRINHDRLDHQGSGYVARHEPDFMLANDPWFRGIALKYGPDGGVFVSDWTDTGECHNYKAVDQSNGRIYKIAYGKVKPWKGDLSKLRDEDLLDLQGHKNEWQGRHARRLLQERAHDKTLERDTIDELRKRLRAATDPRLTLRFLWALCSIDPKNPAVTGFLRSGNPAISAWAWRFYMSAYADSMTDQTAERIGWDFREQKLPQVRLAMASALQHVKAKQRPFFLINLGSEPEDANDANLPLMLWYAVEPLAEANPDEALALAQRTSIPLLRRFLVRRLVEVADKQPEHWSKILGFIGKLAGDAERIGALNGVEDGIQGQRQVKTPAGWPNLYAQLQKSRTEEVRRIAMKLAVVFGDAQAVSQLRRLAADKSAAAAERTQALQALLYRQQPDLLPLLRDLLDDPALRTTAIRGLAAFNDAETAKLLLSRYAKLGSQEKADVVQTLASRPAWAMALLDAVDGKQVPRSDVSVFVARQMQGLKDKRVGQRLAKVWGQIKPASAEKTELMTKFKKLLTPEVLKTADLSKGRLVFSKNCATCHRLYDDGGDIGPALTGSQRANLDYVLENVLDPSAVVAREFQMWKVETASGRTITGIIKLETDKAVTIQTPNEVIVLPKDEIEDRKQSPLSIMPEGVLDKLSVEEIRNLVAYLASKDQVALPK